MSCQSSKGMLSRREKPVRKSSRYRLTAVSSWVMSATLANNARNWRTSLQTIPCSRPMVSRVMLSACTPTADFNADKVRRRAALARLLSKSGQRKAASVSRVCRSAVKIQVGQKGRLPCAYRVQGAGHHVRCAAGLKSKVVRLPFSVF